MLLVVLLAQVQLDAGALEDALGLAGRLVDDRWDAAVGCVGGMVSIQFLFIMFMRFIKARLPLRVLFQRRRTVDLKEPFLLLLVLAEVDLLGVVFQAQFFKSNRYLVAVWGPRS